MTMKKKLIALAAATIIAAQSLFVSVSAATYFVAPTDFTDVAAAPGLPIRTDTHPWIYKGSAGTVKLVLEEEEGKKFLHAESDSVKQGTAGEGSFYLYTRKNSGLITDKGFIKFDIRLNSGIIQFQVGNYTDPTKGTEVDGVGALAASLLFDEATKALTATSANGKIVEVVEKFKVGEWYTVRVDIDNKNQEYKVTVTDKDGKEYKTDTLSYVNSTAKDPLIFVFAYMRKQNGHNFDVTNYSVGTGEYSADDEKKALEAKAAPEASAAPTASAAPEASATPTASAAPEASAAPAASEAPAAKKTKLELVIDKTEAKVDGVAKTLDAAPVIVDGRTLVPVRFISENMGGKVDWDAATKTVTITLEGKTIKLVIDSKDVDVDGKKSALDVPAQIISDRTYVPVRFVSESIGAEVKWDDATKTVSIEK